MDSSTRRDTLEAPPQARWVPILVVLGVLVFVALVIVAAMLGGWVAAVLVPAGLFGLALAINVIIALVKRPRKQA